MHIIDLLIKECDVYVFKILSDLIPDPMQSIQLHKVEKNAGDGLSWESLSSGIQSSCPFL